MVDTNSHPEQVLENVSEEEEGVLKTGLQEAEQLFEMFRVQSGLRQSFHDQLAIILHDMYLRTPDKIHTISQIHAVVSRFVSAHLDQKLTWHIAA